MDQSGGPDRSARRAWNQDLHRPGTRGVRAGVSDQNTGHVAEHDPERTQLLRTSAADQPADVTRYQQFATRAHDAELEDVSAAPVMALVGADAGLLADRLVEPGVGWDRRSAGRPESGVGGPAAVNSDIARASTQPPDGDERGNRRGRGGAGPASARALGSKVPRDIGDLRDPRGRPTGARRYLPLRQDPPSAGDPPAEDPFTGVPVSSPYSIPPSTGAPPPPPVTASSGSGGMSWLPDDDSPSITSAFGGDAYSDTATQMLRPFDPGPDDLAADGPAPSLVRPYARTGGRTKPGHNLDLEALVATTVNGREAWSSPLLNPEHVQVIGLCVDTTSVAEIAARLSVPIGVARVIIADMVDLGLVEVGKTSANIGDERDPAFLRRVLSGLQRL